MFPLTRFGVRSRDIVMAPDVGMRGAMKGGMSNTKTESKKTACWFCKMCLCPTVSCQCEADKTRKADPRTRSQIAYDFDAWRRGVGI